MRKNSDSKRFFFMITYFYLVYNPIKKFLTDDHQLTGGTLNSTQSNPPLFSISNHVYPEHPHGTG